MINQDIALSSKVASLSPEALSLFCLIIPHLNSHGKMLANPHTIKGTVCPLIEWLTAEKVEVCLAEISSRTNVKWWEDERGLYYLQSLNWKEHQSLREDRLGPDHLPDYPGDDKTTPGVIRECSRKNPAEGKGSEGKKEGKKGISSDALRLSGLLAELIAGNNPTNQSIKPEAREKSIAKWAVDIDRMLRIDKRTTEEIDAVIRWCQSDSFWSANILSGAKLRKQYDKLLPQMKRANGDNNQTGSAASFAAMGRRVY
jgi:hypothetical protein